MKTPLLLLGICFGLSSMAQSYDIDDTLSTGDMNTYYVLDSNAVNLAAVVGTGVTWDYSTIGAVDTEANDNNIIDRSASDFDTYYPDANYCELFENSVYTFFSNDDVEEEVIVYGFVFQEIENDFIIAYDVDPLVSAKFPMDFGVSYTDDLEGRAILPLAGEVDITGDASVNVDGTGTLIVGDVTYTDVVRVHTVEESEGFVVVFGVTITITRDSYVYYAEGSEMPVFIYAKVDAALGVAGDFGFTAVYSNNEITEGAGIAEYAEQGVALSIYPNPSNTGNLTVNTEFGTEQLIVRNSVGQIVNTLNNPTEIVKLNLNSYENGIYFIEAIKEGKTSTMKFVKN